MRFSYLLALVLTMSVGATYWYESTSHICPIPVSYRLGTIDDSFTITQAEAFEAIDLAIAVWEDRLEQDLFVYDEQADLEVSFIFDDRQQMADEQIADQARLDGVAAQNDQIRAAIQQLQDAYNEQEVAFESRKATYEQELAAYEDLVRQINDRGGATGQEFEALESSRLQLQAESEVLTATAAQINTLAQELNELSTEGNRVVRLYNAEVFEYNQLYGRGEQFTQGDYTGDAIHIYKFSNQDELVTVLAHEFGHALGIDHVEDSGSLMYYLLVEGGESELALSETDVEAYTTVCQTDSWSFKIRSVIRSVIS